MMSEQFVRIRNVKIENFKNVIKGELTFISSDVQASVSILGLYGQNGSGKTTLIDAIELLKYVLTGQTVPDKYADFISTGANQSLFTFDFDVHNAQAKYKVVLSFTLNRVSFRQNNNIEESQVAEERFKPRIINESVRCSYISETQKSLLCTILDSSDDKSVLLPRSKFLLLIGNDPSMEQELIVAKKLTASSSRSFIFSPEFLSTVRKHDKRLAVDKTHIYHALLESLVWFGNTQLFVINTANTNSVSFNLLPVSFRYGNEAVGMAGSLPMFLEQVNLIPQKNYNLVKKLFESMNVVMTQLVPGLTIALKEVGTELLPNGEPAQKIALMSRRGNRELPLKYESEGIKKIVSVLQLLIVVYNRASITVAIDELDSGVFEYLLGELLRIIAAKGKGQLVFTSHNLRPLETLNRKFIAFTTVNELNRYVRLKNVKKTNNLRDFYYRDIMLGSHGEEIYERTHNSEIALAFSEAGELLGA